MAAHTASSIAAHRDSDPVVLIHAHQFRSIAGAKCFFSPTIVSASRIRGFELLMPDSTRFAPTLAPCAGEQMEAAM
jgi:hypothetical protein